MLPAHIAIAVLAIVGVMAVWTFRIVQSVEKTRRLPNMPVSWRRALIVAGVATVASVVWGAVTEHALGGPGTASSVVTPFNAIWREAVVVTVLGGGVFFAIGFAWFLVRTDRPLIVDLCLGSLALLIVGAIAWGARLGDFTMFHAFFGGIAVFVTPVAAIALQTLWGRLPATNRLKLAAGLVVLLVIQLEFGVVSVIWRMQVFGPHDYPPTPVGVLDAIRQLPSNAKLAYACGTVEEVGFATPRLVSIDAHTGHRVVPMCYAAEILTTMIGGRLAVELPSLYFRGAPQQALYPDATARPSSADVTAFMKDHGIGYIYADARHPNSLVADAVPVVTIRDTEILRVP
jgi:hypothetical protein